MYVPVRLGGPTIISGLNISMTDEPTPFRILDNVQSVGAATNLVMMIITRDFGTADDPGASPFDVASFYGEPVEDGKPVPPPRLGFSVKTFCPNDWIRDKTLAEFVTTFPIMEEFPRDKSGKPKWFMDDEQGRELRRASNGIAICSRRGCGSSIYYNGDLKETHVLYNGTPFHYEAVDWVPEGYALVLYEVNPVDTAFLYEPGFGILPNPKYLDYGRLVKIY